MKFIAIIAFALSQQATATRIAQQVLAARSIAAAGKPDPKCHTGKISLPDSDDQQVCCAGYCGECTDYPTCASVRGQNSTFACCASQVLNIRCGGGAAANV